MLEHKQLRYRRSADPGVAEEETDFGPPDRETTEMTDTAGLGTEGDTEDRPGPTAAIEMTTEQQAEQPEPEAPTDQDQHPAGQEPDEAGDGEVKILFDRIDEPGLNTLAVYERRGGYESLRKALEMTPEEVTSN